MKDPPLQHHAQTGLQNDHPLCPFLHLHLRTHAQVSRRLQCLFEKEEQGRQTQFQGMRHVLRVAERTSRFCARQLLEVFPVRQGLIHRHCQVRATCCCPAFGLRQCALALAGI